MLFCMTTATTTARSTFNYIFDKFQMARKHFYSCSGNICKVDALVP